MHFMLELEVEKGFSHLSAGSPTLSLLFPSPRSTIQSTDALQSIVDGNTAWRMKHVLSRYTMINKALRVIPLFSP